MAILWIQREFCAIFSAMQASISTVNKLITNFVVGDLQAFSVVESSDFIKLVTSGFPGKKVSTNHVATCNSALLESYDSTGYPRDQFEDQQPERFDDVLPQNYSAKC